MEIKIQKLISILEKSFEAGNQGLDKDEFIEKIFAKNNIKKENDSIKKDFRIFSISELRQLPVGTTFIHRTQGKCKIVSDGMEKFMEFENPNLNVASFNFDNKYPWDIPMKLMTELEV